MKFEALNDMIPYAMGGKEKVLRMEPYPNVTLAMPGRHAKDTTPKGGDFVVMVTDPEVNWKNHQFKHDDLFKDVAARDEFSLMPHYLDIVRGEDPEYLPVLDILIPGTIDPYTFLCAVQCLAVAEHRRYAHFESKFGGRFLPFRFAAGIDEGLWTAEAAISKQKYGRPAVEQLEKKFGVPELTKELMA